MEAGVVVVGAGAAGLMAGIWAARTARPPSLAQRVVVVDGARKVGAKILVAGGGRCNVTHHAVDESAFAGSSPAAIRKVLRRFDVPATVAFFAQLGVELKREETGKLFPVTDRARTVLDALLRAARDAGVEVAHPWRVAAVRQAEAGFVLEAADGRTLRARRVVLATGGRSLPKSGSDGAGYAMARALGHSVTRDVFPALVPLLLPRAHPLTALSGLSAPARLEVRSATGRRIVALEGAVLCTHFGLSGPAVLDVSRHLAAARREDAGARLIADWLPGATAEATSGALLALGSATVGRWLAARLPARLADTLAATAGLDPATTGSRLTREARRALVAAIHALPLPVTGDRGFAEAEVTAGGIPLSELDLSTMASRLCPGLYVCGEICDVDGRIGGFNFQWAWASGYVAGLGVTEAGRTDQREP